MAIGRPPQNGSGKGESDKRSPLERYLEKQKQTREPKAPRVSPLAKSASTPAKSDAEAKATPSPRRSLLRTAGDSQPDLSSWEKRVDALQTPASQPGNRTAPQAAPSQEISEQERRALEHGAPAMPPPTTNVRPDGPPPGEFGPRLVAYLIDLGIVYVLRWPLLKIMVSLLAIVGRPADAFDGLELLLGYVVMLGYYGWFYPHKGATPGKMLMSLEVIEAEGNARLNPWKAFFREAIGKPVSAIPFFVGYFVAFFRADRRALHDLLFDTRVITVTRNSR